MIGERFGDLIVLHRLAGCGMLECACDGGGQYCRRVSLFSESDLRTGKVTNCGCRLIGGAHNRSVPPTQ